MKRSAPLYLMKALTMCHFSFSPHIPLPYGSCSPVSSAGRESRGSWWSCQALCIAVRPAALSDRPPWYLQQRQSGQTSSLYSAGSETIGHLGVCKERYMWHNYSNKILLCKSGSKTQLKCVLRWTTWWVCCSWLCCQEKHMLDKEGKVYTRLLTISK